jgi:NADH-quinone oxidoreductase subunit G
MSEIKFFIDDLEVVAQKGETILDIARKNGLYIPTMCYLTKVSPIASCRMCVVSVDGLDDFVLSCQTPPTEGIKVITNSDELFKYRQNIMKLYNVNHPLQCGVCDKSGACDLQNKTLELQVDSQSFSVKEQMKKNRNWGIISYDESLCIMCEKCVSVCNEVTGYNALEIKPGGYHSHIKRRSGGHCVNCGECVSVCPVGAMHDTDFKYTSNAWELSKIPAACGHCSNACAMYYEVKHSGVGRSDKKIYRVTNEDDINSVCGAARYGSFFVNNSSKDNDEFDKCIEFFKNAEAIRFNSNITNEEALILQKLKDKFNLKLFNNEALKYKNFLDIYAQTVGKSLYDGSLQTVKDSDFTIILGCSIGSDSPILKHQVSISSKTKKSEVVYMHPIEDVTLENIVTNFIKYEVGTENGVLGLLANLFVDKNKLSKNAKEFFDEFDDGYVSSETNISENDKENLLRQINRKKSKNIIVGADVIFSSSAKEIAILLGYLNIYADFKVTIVPSSVNTLGISLICDLDKDTNENSGVVGYDCDGDYILSSTGLGNLGMPTFSQKEGTVVNIDKRVVPTNVAVMFEGYNLNDIANTLGLRSNYCIDYTQQLPLDKGFQPLDFDSLINVYEDKDNRGYLLNSVNIDVVDVLLEEINSLDTYNGIVIYNTNPILHFDEVTKRSSLLDDKAILRGSKQFAIASKLSDNDEVEFSINGLKLRRKFKIDRHLKGVIALNPTFDLELDKFFVNSNYRFNQVKIDKVEKNG